MSSLRLAKIVNVVILRTSSEALRLKRRMAWIVALSTFSAVLVVTILLLSYYTSLRRTRKYVLLTATIGWYMPFSIVLLFPIDLASTAADNLCAADPDNCARPLFYLSAQTLLLCWRIGYWTTFALTWVIFPILQSYVDSGHRSPRRRLVSALRQNLRYQAIILSIFALGLVYILFTIKINSFSDFESLLIALANTYGLLLAIFCMGHGLVNIPRRIWYSSSLDTGIREIERTAVTAWETKSDAEDDAAATAGEIATWERQCEGRDDALANWVRDLALKSPDPGAPPVPVDDRNLTENYLASLSRRVRMSQNQLLKAQTNWRAVLKRAAYLYDLKSASSTSGKSIEWTLSSRGRFGPMIPGRVQYSWYLGILPWLSRAVAVAAAVLSVSIVWSEVVHNWTSPLLSLVGIVLRATGQVWLLLEILSVAILLYMAYATYSSFMRLKILNMYSLTPHHTDPVSIIFYASYLCRLSVPLTYNFTTLLAPPNENQNLSTFSMFLGQYINLTPLGSGFNSWFPLFILIPVIFTLFSLYEKIKGFVGLGDLGGWIIEDEEDEDRGEIVSVVEGRGILKRELGMTGAAAPPPSRRPVNREGRVLGSERPERPARTPYTDSTESDDDDNENFFVATGNRLWNSISSRVDDLRTGTAEDRGDDEEGGLLGRIPRPKWLKRGDSGVGVWRFPRWGKAPDEGRVVI